MEMQSSGQSTPTQPPAPVRKTWMPTTAGILTIIAGAVDIIGGIFLMAIMPAYTRMMSGYGAFGPYEQEILGMMGLFGIPIIILGIVALIGGIYALKRRVWGIALAGAICALFSWGGILGILSIIFVSISKKEFV